MTIICIEFHFTLIRLLYTTYITPSGGYNQMKYCINRTRGSYYKSKWQHTKADKSIWLCLLMRFRIAAFPIYGERAMLAVLCM